MEPRNKCNKCNDRQTLNETAVAAKGSAPNLSVQVAQRGLKYLYVYSPLTNPLAIGFLPRLGYVL
jgi:hypothetical protein